MRLELVEKYASTCKDFITYKYHLGKLVEFLEIKFV